MRVAPETERDGARPGRAAVTVDRLQVSYRSGGLGVTDVSLELPPAAVVALVGPNGSGKTTTVRAMTGFMRSEGARVTAGTVVTHGCDTTNWEPYRVARLGTAFIPERGKTFTNLSVRENLLATQGPSGQRPAPDDVERVLEMFPILRNRHAELAGRLSGGQQQMLAIARAVARRPRILVIDEVTLGLHHSLYTVLGEAIRSIAGGGTSVLLVDESLEFVLDVADAAYVLADGRVAASGTAEEVRRSPEVTAAYLTGETGPEPTSTVAASNPASARRAGSAADPPALRCISLTVRFGGVMALDDIDLSVEPGSFTAVIGPNGAGKSSLLNAICGLDRHRREGKVELAGRDCTGLRPDQVAAAGIGRAYQTPRLLEDWSALENVLCGAHGQLLGTRRGRWRPRGRAHQVRLARGRAMRLLEELGLADLAGRPCALLSYGQRKLVDIARALVSDPKILLLDEPGSGLDEGERQELEGVLLRLRRPELTVLMVEHHMNLVRATCDRAVALERGRVLAHGPTEAVLGDAEVTRSYVGMVGDAPSRKATDSAVRGTEPLGVR